MDIDPKLLPYLLAGGGSALAGGALTAMGGERPGEGRWARRWRILRNALLTGGAGVGATALINKGIQDTVTEPLPSTDQDPTMAGIHSVADSPWTRGGAAAYGAKRIWDKSQVEEQGEARNALLKAQGNSAEAAVAGNKSPSGVARDFNTNPKGDLKTELNNYLGVLRPDKTKGSPAVRDKLDGDGNVVKPGKPEVPPGNTMTGAVGQLNNDYFRQSGINRPLIEMRGGDKALAPGTPLRERLFGQGGKAWREGWGNAAKEQAAIIGQRATGIGRVGGISRRLLPLTAALALPEVVSRLTEPEQ